MNPIQEFYTTGWTDFAAEKGRQQPLPAEYELVSVLIESRQPGNPNCAAIGYLRFAAGDKDSPSFIVPGFPRVEDSGMPVLFRVLGWKRADLHRQT